MGKEGTLRSLRSWVMTPFLSKLIDRYEISQCTKKEIIIIVIIIIIIINTWIYVYLFCMNVRMTLLRKLRCVSQKIKKKTRNLTDDL